MSRTSLLISRIRRDGGTQSRASTDDVLAAEYGQLLKTGVSLADPVCFFDGNDYWLADGFHTIRGCELVNLNRITVDVRKGTLRDALLFSLGTNSAHGKRRSHDDLRHAVRIILEDEEWKGKPNTWIAKTVCVDESTVRAIKKELASETKIVDNSGHTRTAEIANGEDAIQNLDPAERVAWESMTAQEQEGILQRSLADALDERVAQLEIRASRIFKLLGDGHNCKHIRTGLKHYLNGLRMSIGWESERSTEVTEEIAQQVKSQLDQMRRLHAELPAARQNDKKLESLWSKVKKCVGSS